VNNHKLAPTTTAPPFSGPVHFLPTLKRVAHQQRNGGSLPTPTANASSTSLPATVAISPRAHWSKVPVWDTLPSNGLPQSTALQLYRTAAASSQTRSPSRPLTDEQCPGCTAPPSICSRDHNYLICATLPYLCCWRVLVFTMMVNFRRVTPHAPETPPSGKPLPPTRGSPFPVTRRNTFPSPLQACRSTTIRPSRPGNRDSFPPVKYGIVDVPRLAHPCQLPMHPNLPVPSQYSSSPLHSSTAPHSFPASMTSSGSSEEGEPESKEEAMLHPSRRRATYPCITPSQIFAKSARIARSTGFFSCSMASYDHGLMTLSWYIVCPPGPLPKSYPAVLEWFWDQAHPPSYPYLMS